MISNCWISCWTSLDIICILVWKSYVYHRVWHLEIRWIVSGYRLYIIIDIICVSYGYHPWYKTISLKSSGDHLDFIWISFGYRLDIIWILFEYRLDIEFVSHRRHKDHEHDHQQRSSNRFCSYRFCISAIFPSLCVCTYLGQGGVMHICFWCVVQAIPHSKQQGIARVLSSQLAWHLAAGHCSTRSIVFLKTSSGFCTTTSAETLALWRCISYHFCIHQQSSCCFIISAIILSLCVCRQLDQSEVMHMCFWCA